MLTLARRHKALTVLLVLALVLVVPVLVWAYYLNRQLSEIPRFSTTTTTDIPGVERPERPAGESMNILLLGSDDPDGADDGPSLEELLASGTWDPGAFRSDTILVLHLDADRTGGQLVSLPRDSWVEIPGHGQNKINAAFSLGGPALMQQTVEQVTGLYIDHAMIVDFAGFEEITRIVGGVEVFVPETVTDSARDRVWTEGIHHIEGEEALDYVRQRYGLPGGDFDRIQRQQNFLRALLHKLTSTGVVANPKRVTALAGELAETVAVDEEFTPSAMRDLALSLRSFDSSRLEFATAPHNGTGMVGAASVVHLDVPATRDMFTAIGEDDFEAWVAENEAELLPDEQSVN